MRTTSIRDPQIRVYDDTGEKFCCSCHFGAENNAIMKLLDITWGYAVVEDRMMLLPNDHPPVRYRHELVRRIDGFSTKTPEEIRRVLEGIADQRAGVDSKR